MALKFQDHESIYFKREVLYHSLEGRDVELLTLTGRTRMTEKREEVVEGLLLDAQERPQVFEKQTVFLTSRVHPGETPASFVLNGILNFLSNSQNDQAKILRDNFVFKIIPILNPDGVSRGYYRLDTKN